MIQGWDKLKHWPLTLEKFRRAAEKDSASLSALPGDGDKRASHLKTISHLLISKDIAKIKLNIQIAALHMAHLLQSDSNVAGYLDMPETIEDILSNETM